MTSVVCAECGFNNEIDATYCEECGVLMEKNPDSDSNSGDCLFIHSTGDVIDKKYEIVAVVKTGNTDSSYIAIDLNSEGKMVWVKHRKQAAEEYEAQKSLYEILLEESHENVVKPLEIISREDCIYIIFEKNEGENLKSLIDADRESITQDDILDWAIQAARGMKFLHSHAILHLDMQPAHLFLTDEDVVKVSGLSRITSMRNINTDNSVTEGFSPPEAYGLMGGRLGQRSDIFSLGATIYYLLAGKVPKLSRESFFNFPLLSEVAEDMDPDFEQIVMRAVKKEPIARFDGIDEMLEELTRLREKGLNTRQAQLRELSFEIFAKSHVGRVRKINQDSYLVSGLDSYEKSRASKYDLLVVADGMGGEAEGDKASSLAVRVIAQEVTGSFLPINNSTATQILYPEDDVQARSASILARAIHQANKVVYEYSRKDQARRGMGSTISAGLIMGDNLCLGHAGDTRCYAFNPHTGLQQLTEDHSLVGRLVRLGQLTREEALRSPQRSAVYRALGTTPTLEVDIYQYQIQDEDIIIFCSDGIWEYFPDRELSSIILREGSPQKIAEKLVQTCLDRGADDNATLIVLKASDSNGVKQMKSRKDKTETLKPISDEQKRQKQEEKRKESISKKDKKAKKNQDELLAEKFEKVIDEKEKARESQKEPEGSEEEVAEPENSGENVSDEKKE